MPQLTIDLQNGFSNDEVILRVAGTEVLRKSEVTTNLAISRAASHPVEVEESPAEVEVLVPSRKLQGAIRVDVARTPYLGVNIEENELQLQPSETMFFYL